jgi:hypothetical protein
MEADRINKLIGPRYGGARSNIAVPRSGPGIGIGPTLSGRESNPAPRPTPPGEHMRSERPASAARRLWPNLR